MTLRKASCRRRFPFIAAALVLLLLSAASPRAEISCNPGTIGFIVMGITEGPDPVLGPGIWDPVGPEDGGTLNTDGDDRVDGRPDIVMDMATNTPSVVWSYNTGIDFDIAFSRWTGQSWTVKEFLTDSITDELDPRIFINPVGDVFVVWWELASSDRVYLTSRLRDGDEWTVRELITDDGRRPSVLATASERFVAFERSVPTGGLDVVVQIANLDGSKTLTVAAHSTRSQPLDVILHESFGRTWMEWKHSDSEVAYSEYVDGAWVAPATLPWLDPGWVGIEDVRRAVRLEVLGD